MSAPPFAYYGGKVTLAGRIVDLLPAHESYVEPFAGSLAVLLAKRRSKLETVNDLDGDLMTFWRVLRDQPDALAAATALTPHSRAEHALAYGDINGLPDLERARRVWVRLSQGRAGTLRKTGWRFYQDPHGTSSPMPGYLAGYTARIPTVAHRLAGVSLECRPALDVIEAYGQHADALLYVDPPYLGSTRVKNYRHEMPDEASHRDLADALKAARAAVVLSGYPSPLYDELYADWHVTRLDTWTGNGRTAGGARVEVLWSNRDLTPDHLFGGAA